MASTRGQRGVTATSCSMLAAQIGWRWSHLLLMPISLDPTSGKAHLEGVRRGTSMRRSTRLASRWALTRCRIWQGLRHRLEAGCDHRQSAGRHDLERTSAAARSRARAIADHDAARNATPYPEVEAIVKEFAAKIRRRAAQGHARGNSRRVHLPDDQRRRSDP